jgi:hypothetical protein
LFHALEDFAETSNLFAVLRPVAGALRGDGAVVCGTRF